MGEVIKDTSLKEYGVELLMKMGNGLYRAIKMNGFIIMGYVLYIGFLEMLRYEFPVIYEKYAFPVLPTEKMELYYALVMLIFSFYMVGGSVVLFFKIGL